MDMIERSKGGLMTMSETTKEMQRLLEEVAATPELSGKMAEALQHLDFGEIARLANELSLIHI